MIVDVGVKDEEEGDDADEEEGVKKNAVDVVLLEERWASLRISKQLVLASGGTAAIHGAGSSFLYGCGPTSGALSHPWSFVESLRCAGSTTPAVYETHPH